MHPLIHYVHIHFIQCFLFLVILSLYINFTFNSQFCLFSVNLIERLFYFIRDIFFLSFSTSPPVPPFVSHSADMSWNFSGIFRGMHWTKYWLV
ncbi:hypothetical protein I7I53_05930 [Histoplasma capsulatum var. duboisii H88]|uniref:Uncharacterized protein n=1 Tax=Ajellomyces capsulatus (strain H88) TaxID=544711 RepID=A0A8A1L9N8_AJEC8|nr:hypothetical protein I7I53_05930 [Histoplasma capsulatum var. duboisii H88]